MLKALNVMRARVYARVSHTHADALLLYAIRAYARAFTLNTFNIFCISAP